MTGKTYHLEIEYIQIFNNIYVKCIHVYLLYVNIINHNVVNTLHQCLTNVTNNNFFITLIY